MRFTIIRRHLLSFWAPQHPSSPSRVITAPIVMLKIPTLTYLWKSSVKGGKTFIKESPSTVTHIPAAAKHMPASCQKTFPLFTSTNTQLHFNSDMLMLRYKYDNEYSHPVIRAVTTTMRWALNEVPLPSNQSWPNIPRITDILDANGCNPLQTTVYIVTWQKGICLSVLTAQNKAVSPKKLRDITAKGHC